MRRAKRIAIWAVLTSLVGLAVVALVVKEGREPVPDRTAEYQRGGTNEVGRAWAESSKEVLAARALREWRGAVAMVKGFDDDFTPEQYDEAYGWLVEKAFAERDYALTLQMLDECRAYSSLPEIDLFRAYVAGQLRRKGYLAEMQKANEESTIPERALVDRWIRANLAWARKDFTDVVSLTESSEPESESDVCMLAQPWFQHLHLKALVKLKRHEAVETALLAGMPEHLAGRTAFVSVQAYRDRTILEGIEATGGDIRSYGQPYGPGFTRTDKFLCMLDDVSFDSDRAFFRQKMGELEKAFDDALAAKLTAPAGVQEDFEALQRLFKEYHGKLFTSDDTVVRWKDTEKFRMFEFAHHTVVIHPRGWSRKAFEVMIFAGHVKSYDNLFEDIYYAWDKSAQRYVSGEIECSIENPRLRDVSFHGFYLGQASADAVALEAERIRRRWPGDSEQRDICLETMVPKYNVSTGDWGGRNRGYFSIHYKDGRVADMRFYTAGLPLLGSLALFDPEFPVLAEGEFEISPALDGKER